MSERSFVMLKPDAVLRRLMGAVLTRFEERGLKIVAAKMMEISEDLAKEIIRCNALDRVHIGLDYFDASINRIGAYIVGTRATQKCILQALLEPLPTLRRYEDAGQNFERLALLEEAKSMPFGAVFDYFNLKNGVPVGEEYIPSIQQYEKEVLSKRA